MKTATLPTAIMSLSLLTSSLAQVSFTRITDGPIATDTERSWGCTLVDYDNDGLTDVFVATTFGGSNCLYHNDGNFQFSRVTSQPVVTAASDVCTGIFGDYDNDGDLDLFTTGFDQYKRAASSATTLKLPVAVFSQRSPADPG